MTLWETCKDSVPAILCMHTLVSDSKSQNPDNPKKLAKAIRYYDKKI